MKSRTLDGTNKQIYCLLKVLKYVTGSSAKSYQCKFAVHNVLQTKTPATGKFGQTIQEVINYRNIRGKFNSVHQDLKNLGVTKIEIGDNGLNFEGSNSSHFKILKYLSTYYKA